MKYLPLLLIPIIASCAPRAIIGEPVDVRSIDTTEVEESGQAVDKSARRIRDANRDASASNARAQSTSRQLSQAIDRAERMAEGQEQLERQLAETRRLVDQSERELAETAEALFAAREESEMLAGIIVDHRGKISTLQADAQEQASDIETLQAQNRTLRKQAEVSVVARDKLSAAQSRATTMTWVAVGAVVLLGVVITLILIIKPVWL